MLGQFQALRLVIRAESCAVQLGGPFDQVFIDEPSNELTMFQDKRNFMASNFQNRACACASCRCVTKTGIEETGIVDAEFSYQRIKRHHFGCMEGWHMDGFP